MLDFIVQIVGNFLSVWVITSRPGLEIYIIIAQTPPPSLSYRFDQSNQIMYLETYTYNTTTQV